MGTYATVATFDAAEHGFKVGQLRTRTWQTLESLADRDFASEPTEAGKIWIKRCEGYWERQMRRFGVVMSNHTELTDVIDGICYVTTYATVLAVLPGTRK